MHLDRTQSDPVVAGRNAVGVAVPLVAAAAAGNVTLGLAATIGALQSAFADRPGPYRLRIVRMLGTALAAAVTSGLAIAASRSDAGSLVLLLIFGFVAGLLQAGGPAATQVGVAAVAASLVLGHTPQPAGVVWHVAPLVLAGGAVQTLLAIAAWPLGRHRPERLALAGVYRELAAVARALPGTAAGPPVGITLEGARQTLYGLGHDHGPSVEAYRVLLDEAERIRREVVVLSGLAERLAAEHGTAADCIRDALAAAASVLDEVDDALERGREVDTALLAPTRDRLRRAADALAADPEPARALSQRAAAGRVRALSGQLRAVVETAEAGASEGQHGERRAAPGARVLRDPIAVLRANLTWESAIFRHAVRLALLVAATDLVARLSHVGRGYWLPLTVLVVLRPDFTTTLQRAVLRIIGTIVGLVLATVLVHWVPGGVWWHIALIAAFAFGMRFSGPGNIALMTVCLSGLIVVLLELNGVSARSTLEDRSLATLAGGALAVLAVAALPAWERRFLPGRLVALLAAYRRYLDVLADPDAGRAELQRARKACRLARSNAQASVDRARGEPVRGEAEVELGQAVLAHSHRLINALLGVEAVRRPVGEAGGVPQLRAFLEAAGAELDAAREALDDNVAPRALPALRPVQVDFADALLAEPARAGGVETATALAEATDRITNSLDTLLDELRRQLPLRTHLERNHKETFA